ncbi:MAG: hypothetical protein RL011_705 [Pseudomonadota bacterium]|jgi:TrpR-related protein YerC/YecD
MRQISKSQAHHLRELCQALIALESVDECRRFLTDLCTPGELAALADRWQVARLIEEGVPYRRIYEKTGVSTATVTRVARALSYGEGGYRAVLGKAGKSILSSGTAKEQDQ